MLDAKIRGLIDPTLTRWGQRLARRGWTANGISVLGLCLGLAASIVLAVGGAVGIALVLLLAGRVADGLDGAVARASTKTDFGGYLDITCDWVFYAAIPFAFVLRDPSENLRR
jgi:phosphatidylglycerophosphate synthase